MTFLSFPKQGIACEMNSGIYVYIFPSEIHEANVDRINVFMTKRICHEYHLIGHAYEDEPNSDFDWQRHEFDSDIKCTFGI